MNLKFDINKLRDFVKNEVKFSSEKSKEISMVSKAEDCSWDEYIELQNINTPLNIACFYRGNIFSYEEIISKKNLFAASLKSIGVKKGDRVPVCMSSTPEFLIALEALSKVGAVASIFGENFDDTAIMEILDNSDKKLLLATDNKYRKIKDLVAETHFDNIVISSLTDSYLCGVNPYYSFDRDYYSYDETVFDDDKFAKVYSFSSFMNISMDYGDLLFETVSGNDAFVILYTGNIDKYGNYERMVYTHKSFIMMDEVKEYDLASILGMKHLRVSTNLPTYINSFITILSTTLFKGDTFAMEPIEDPSFFAKSLIINKANKVIATSNSFVNAAKISDKVVSNYTLPYLYLPIIIKENNTTNEELFINNWLRKIKAGTSLIGFPFTSTKLSFKGEFETDDLLFSLYHDFKKKTLQGREKAFEPIELAKIAIMDDDDDELIKIDGDTYKNCNLWIATSKSGKVRTFGKSGNEFHLSDGTTIIPNTIANIILKDTKNILSCEVINTTSDDNVEVPIAHIAFKSDKAFESLSPIIRADDRIKKTIPIELANKILYRLHSAEEGFYLDPFGRKSIRALEDESISDKCFRPLKTDYGIAFDNNIDKYIESSKVKVKS